MNERGGNGIRERHRCVYRQKLRETDRRTEGVIGLLERERERQTDRQTDRLSDRQTYRRRDRLTDRQRE